MIVPEGVNHNVKSALTSGAGKMDANGENENILQSIVGVVKWHYDVKYDDKASGESAFSGSYEYDKNSLQATIDKFKELYGADNDIGQGLNRFSNIVNNILDDLQDTIANPVAYYGSEATKKLLKEQMEEFKKQQEETVLNLVDGKPQDLKTVLQKDILAKNNQKETSNEK